jgi:MFS transporter, DHA1 family, multidrug resistance protein
MRRQWNNMARQTEMLKDKWPVIYSGLLMSVTAFSIDITLPAIPAIAREFNAPVSIIQLTISLFVLALGLGQLFWGIFSDRYGRKPAIIGGLSLFILASLAAAFSTTPEMLIAARVVQGLGASAAGTTARAMIRDLYSGPQLAANMAIATSIFAIGPILAPFIGAAFLTFISWRAVFVGLAVLALLLLAGLMFIGETSRYKTPISFHEIGNSVSAILSNRQSRYFLLYGPVIMSSMIFILSMVPAVFAAAYSVEGLYFAALFALHGIGIIIGQQINRILILRIGVSFALAAGAWVLVAAALIMVGLVLLGLDGPITISLSLVLFATSFLVVVSNGGSLVLDPHGKIAAFAAAFSGSAAQLGAGLAVSIMLGFLAPTASNFAFGLLAICICALLPALWWLKTSQTISNAKIIG